MSGSLQSLGLALSSTLFSIYIPLKHHTNKDISFYFTAAAAQHQIPFEEETHTQEDDTKSATSVTSASSAHTHTEEQNNNQQHRHSQNQNNQHNNKDNREWGNINNNGYAEQLPVPPLPAAVSGVFDTHEVRNLSLEEEINLDDLSIVELLERERREWHTERIKLIHCIHLQQLELAARASAGTYVRLSLSPSLRLMRGGLRVCLL